MESPEAPSAAVAVYGAEQIENRIGFWMEFVHGRTLKQLHEESGRYSAQEALLFGLDVCRALAELLLAYVSK